jgi:hypothetical protein
MDMPADAEVPFGKLVACKGVGDPVSLSDLPML